MMSNDSSVRVSAMFLLDLISEAIANASVFLLMLRQLFTHLRFAHEYLASLCFRMSFALIKFWL
jgi:hypothetical protein